MTVGHAVFFSAGCHVPLTYESVITKAADDFMKPFFTHAHWKVSGRCAKDLVWIFFLTFCSHVHFTTGEFLLDI